MTIRLDEHTLDLIARAQAELGGIPRSAAIRVIIRTLASGDRSKISHLTRVLHAQPTPKKGKTS